VNTDRTTQPTPTLSIVTAVYNGEKFISGCIDSVTAQNCPQVEHIIVDGGSTDRTVQILSEMAETRPHLRWKSERDRGQSDALNKGIGMARAEYVGILNVDDFYEPGALSRVLNILKGLSGPRLIVGACNVLTTDDRILDVNRPRVLKFKNIMVDDGLWPYPQNPAAYFYPKSIHNVIGPYNVEEHFGMDLEFIFKVIQAIEPIYIDDVLGNFRLIPGTKTYHSMQSGECRAVQRKIRKAAWRQAPLKTKMQVAILWTLHRPKRTYWNCRRRLARGRRLTNPFYGSEPN
jgi:glycosyltransferase involved in cell wall biosynthesis